MKIDIHCKGMDLTDAIRDHVEDKLGKLERILPGETDLLAILNFESGSRGGLYSAEITLRAWGTDIVVKETDEDLYHAITAVADSGFSRARRVKDKRSSRRKGAETLRNYVEPPEPMTIEEEEEELPPHLKP